MDLQAAIKSFKAHEQNARNRGNAVIRDAAKKTSTVGKHEARNYAHLRAVLEEADKSCPRAADTIRWLIWHEILDAQWAMHMVEMIEPKEGQSDG